ncbi:transglutaminase family protein [Paracoccus seriniphilus]|uniref:Transglutaminase-like enzyme, putative cysteine protease n=1 Tax=Paracoccus seriniphilus TaxID=184748 RepID=A0A239PLK2_9RHOB|nr:transglutaminase family protein [Paracoccus seriniphilus]WCR13706.1 transglutaminase family protein [Paracoccus seriniphilus]SNT68691.1 Transglutaminase-like enzyme, putative cysteine protease [Paracoccus seriniphilus]
MKLSISHTTEYAYSAPVDYALQKVRLRPMNSPVQTVHDWSVEVSGGKVETSYTDQYGNHVDLVSITPGAQVLRIHAGGHVTTLNDTGVLGTVNGRTPLWLFCQETPLTAAGEAIRALPRVSDNPETQLAGLHDLSAAILDALPYQSGGTAVDTPAETAMQGDHGVCQDHAQIFISAARLSGLPARYVSGYLMINDQIAQDATHAWAEVHLAGLGWVGFDVSNGVSPDRKYVRIAVGRDARDAAPIEGLRMGSADETLMVSLQVQQ